MIDLLVQIVIVGAGGWRLASLLVNETGPWGVFEWIRGYWGIPRGPGEIPSGLIPGILSCIWCASVWTCTGLMLAWYIHPMLAALPAAWAFALVTDKAAR